MSTLEGNALTEVIAGDGGMMGKGIVTFRLKSTKRDALDAIAAITGRDRRDILNEAIDAYLDTHCWQVEHIKKGLRQAESGQFASESEVGRALTAKASKTSRGGSERANEAARRSLAEDVEDLKAFQERAAEPSLAFEAVPKRLKRRGRL